MSSASIKKIIPCKKEQLVEMVLDIEKYPEFVPWCIEGKVFDRNESADLITFNVFHPPPACLSISLVHLQVIFGLQHFLSPSRLSESHCCYSC